MRVIQYKDGFHYNLNVNPKDYAIKLKQECTGPIVGDSPDLITIIISFNEFPNILHSFISFEYEHHTELPEAIMFEAPKIMEHICSGAELIKFNFIVQKFKEKVEEFLNEKF